MLYIYICYIYIYIYVIYIYIYKYSTYIKYYNLAFFGKRMFLSRADLFQSVYVFR